MEEALIAHLLAWPAVAALAGDRLDWGQRNAALPAGRMQVVSSTPFHTFAGRDGLLPYRVQIDSFGLTYGDAKLLARAIDEAMQALPRPAFDSSFLLSERDGQDKDAADQPVHRNSRDYRILHHTT